MALSKDQRTEMVDTLIANCEHWSDGDREILNEFDDAKLQYIYNAELDDDDGEDDDDDDVPAPVGNNLSKYSDDEVEAEFMKRKKKKVTANYERPPADLIPNKPQTPDEWLQSAPSEIRSAVENAMALERDKKKELVQRLIENTEVAGGQLKAITNSLWQKSVAELEQLAQLLPKKETPNRVPSFFGAAGAPSTLNSLTDEDQDDFLELPTINWGEAAAEQRGQRAAV